MKSEMDQTAGDKLGIKGLSKGKRRKLEAYQHLFYLLQVIKCAKPVPTASLKSDVCLMLTNYVSSSPFRQTRAT